MLRSVLVVCVVLALLPLSVIAKPTINCHCFRDRTFDPAQPSAADDYFLATSQNSFFAARFKISKKTIVIKKQRGIAAADLWLAYWLGEKSSQAGDILLGRKQAGESWNDIVSWLELGEKELGKAFNDGLQGELNQDNMGGFHLDQLIVDQILVDAALLKGDELQRLRRASATNKMVILLAALSYEQSATAEQIYTEVTDNGRSWGALITQYKLKVRQLPQLFEQMLPSA